MPADTSNNEAFERLHERLERVFPNYLTAFGKKRLSEHLSAYPDDKHYYSYSRSWDAQPGPLQGDGWSGFTKLEFSTAQRQIISGIVISNSCDIDEANESLRDIRVVFAPIIPLATYEARLRALPDVSSERIDSHLDSIRKQYKSDIFYLPRSNATPEAIVLFDDVATQPLFSFAQTENCRRLFRLNNYGFYLFLMKLSISFCRFGENLDRAD